ncbi:MAG: hypothetical protein ACLFQY_17335 [Desulfococcaceae bacterium]
MKTENNNENLTSDRKRVFQIPAGYELERLTRDVAQWLKTDQGMETEVIPLKEGRLIQGKASGGRLSRLIHRKAESLHVALIPSESRVTVWLGQGDWVKADPEKAKDSGKFRLRNVVSYARETAESVVETAATGISDLWTGSETADAVFEFIGRQIGDQFRAISGGRTEEIDSRLSRYIESRSSVESSWLAGYLQSGEILLAWLQTDSRPPNHSNAEWRFLMTTERSALAGFSGEGFAALQELPQSRMAVTDAFGKDTVTLGGAEWRTRFSNDMLFQEIAPLSVLGPLDRLYQAARLNIIHRDKDRDPLRYGRDLLHLLVTLSGDPLHTLTRMYVDHLAETDDPEPTLFHSVTLTPEWLTLTRALPAEVSGDRLRRWAESWKLSPWNRIGLAGLIQDAAPDSAAHAELILPLLTRARADLKKENRTRKLMADIRYAQALGRLGKQPEAVRLLEERLSELPDETLADLLPAPDADLTKGEGGQLMRVRMLELLVDLRGVPDTDDVDTLRALGVLQPLVPERLRRLRTAADGPVRDRADTVLNLLESGGFGTASTEVPPRGSASPLSPEDIQGRIRHPASREGTAIHKLQGMLAAKKVPDHSSLKSFAKRVTPENHPEVASAISDGTVLFRMSSVEAYIAFGDLDTGIRGYEAKPSFILIGGNHFEAESSVLMTPAELRFLIGGELAHIKFGHERITSREVWEGVFDKALTFVELVPVVGTYLSKLGRFGRMAGQATEMAKKVGNVKQYVSHAQNMLTTTQDIYRRKSGTAAPVRKRTEEEDLVGAFRVMQLTADRAGLILCGDPGAAVRAIFKSSPGLVPDLPTAEQYGLFAFLSRTDDQGALMYQELAVRIAALFSFYLSEEYQQLKATGYSFS